MKRAIFISAIGSAIGLAIAACNTPTPKLRLALSGGPSQACPSTNCAAVSMHCAAVMSIRISDPRDPDVLYLSQCVEISTNGANNMCAIASVDLDPTPIPVRDLEVQVAMYPRTEIPTDPMDKNTLLCPPKVAYSAVTGFPVDVEQSPTPALGGRAFYHPGEEKVIVTLGCTDLAAINDSCVESNLVTMTATVDDFDTLLPVVGGSPGPADPLRVSVGEPHGADGTFKLDAADLQKLDATGDGPIATWTDDLPYRFLKYACVEVLETAAQTTATLRCKAVTGIPSPPRLDLRGVWIERDLLRNKIVSALEPAEVPDAGLTVGIVVDPVGKPVMNAVVSASTGTVKYLSQDGKGFGTGATSDTGIFVSTDAVFGTEVSTGGAGQPTSYGIGGLVEGRVTVVILQSGEPSL
jgi:hypothetical protein